jgi:2-polyprenyl-6-hydroxyphenyl methylase/3-demethylubiquinone-9 3-methyltransferase
VLRWVPAGPHDWNKFLKPEELVGFLDGADVAIEGPFGVTLDIPSWTWKRSADSDVNYMMTFKKPA